MIYDKFDLDTAMIPFWSGDTAVNESVMFLGESGEAKLLYKADNVISVRSSDLKTELRECTDYIFDKETNTLKRIAGGNAPYASEEYFYSADPNMPEVVLMTDRGGTPALTRYDEKLYLHQVFVTYTHSDSWAEPVQESYAGTFVRLTEKLKKGEDVTMVFYGDSITYGASATSTHGNEPMSPTWPVMITEYIAAKYGYNVRYINPGIDGTPPVPDDITGRSGGTITYINTAVGGWQITDGIDKYDIHIKPFVEQYGCDFFLMAFGMNDGWRTADDERTYQKALADRVLAGLPDVSLLLVSTMEPNPDATNGWYGNQHTYEPMMSDLAAEYRAAGFAAGIARMSSASRSILKYKKFRDYAGNNINHPNDYFVRVYAQVICRAIIG